MSNSDGESPGSGVSGAKALKVWNSTRKSRKGIVAFSWSEMDRKCRNKFSLEENARTAYCLEDDGTDVDDEYFSCLESNTVVMLLVEGEEWSPVKQRLVLDSMPDEERNVKLEELVKTLRGKKTEKTEKTTRKKETRRVQIGWAHYDQRQRRFIQVRSQQGGGSPFINIDERLSYEEMLEKLIQEFFPDGRSSKGKRKKFTFKMGNLNGRPVDATSFQRLDHYLQSRSRIYLLSKRKEERIIDLLSESSSEDDLMLPSISPPLELEADPMMVDSHNQVTSQSSVGLQNQLGALAGTPVVVTSQSSVGLQNQLGALAGTPVVARQTAQQHYMSPVTQAGTPTARQTAQQHNMSPEFQQAGTPTVSFRQEVTCGVCADRQKDAFMVPCGHSFCMVCATQVQCSTSICPVCRVKIERVNSLYFS